jgi:methyl-accepting chemotaxis protein
MTSRAISNIGFGIVIVVLVLTSWLSMYNASQFAENAKMLTHTYQVQDQVREISLNMVNAETGQRGYVITGDENYLEPYRTAVAKISSSLNTATQLTVDNPHQQERLNEIKPLVTEKMDEMAEVINVRKAQGFDAAARIVLSGKGKQAMDDVRRLLGEMQNEEIELLNARQKAATDSMESARNVIIAGTAIAVIITIAVIIAFNLMTARLQEVLKTISATVNSLTSSSAELLAGATQQSAGAQEQAAAVAQTVTTVDEVKQTAEQAAQRASIVAESAQRALEIGKTGRKAVDESVSAMGIVKDQTEAIAGNILELAEKAQAIGEIIGSVNDVADQTNLLALNAGIEAARAGEHGSGFTVVAREIKDLAGEAKKATAKVRQILGDIQKATNSAVMVAEEGTKSVNVTLKAVDRAGETIRSLVVTVEDAATAADQIAASAAQQATGMSQVQQAMRDINTATKQSLASTKQAERAAQDLDSVGTKLKQLLAS